MNIRLGSIFLFLLMSLVTNLVFAQTLNTTPTLANIILPPPNAAEITKFSSLNVGLSTGTLQYDIPVYTIKLNSFEMPISLQYATGGVRVDQIASRVGLGWSLNAGGCITRQIRGVPDEYSNYSPLPSNWKDFDLTFLNYLKQVTSSGSDLDPEPDLFNFNVNGNTGTFVLDSNRNAIISPYGNIKIEFLRQTAPEQPIFSMLMSDGTKYIFSSVEKSTQESVCFGSSIPARSMIATSWYLSQILTTCGDSISFSYTDCFYTYNSGISQVFTKSDDGASQNPCSSCKSFYNEQTCANSISVYGKCLSSIRFRDNYINFDYVNRIDFKSPGDPSQSAEKLLERISVGNAKVFTLYYENGISDSRFSSPYGYDTELLYRPFLVCLGEKNMIDEGISRKHKFIYNDINGLPPRLSFSQDLWGFFNGKLNTSLMSPPETAAGQSIFPQATANREPDFDASIKGSLSSIIYPTGGFDSIVYELNSCRTREQLPAPTNTISVKINPSSNYPTTANSTQFVPYEGGNIVIKGGGIFMSGSDDSTNTEYYDVLEIDVVRMSDEQTVYSRTLKQSEVLNEDISNLLSGGTPYYIKITTLMPSIKASIGATYVTGPSQTIVTNKNIGGIRVSKIIHENISDRQIKKYYYSYLDSIKDDNRGSSGNASSITKNMQYGYSVAPCQGNSIESPSGAGLAAYFKCFNYTLFSSSLVTASSSPVYYSNVIEADGENIENGGIEHSFILEPDHLSKPLLGTDVPLGIRTSNTGVRNGVEKSTLTFKFNNNEYQPLSLKTYNYSIDDRINTQINGFAINKHSDWPVEYSSPTSEQFDGYEISNYSFYSLWMHLDSTIETQYGQNGGSIQKNTIYYYGNPRNIQPSIIKINDSKHMESSLQYFYPADIVDRGITFPYAEMVNKNKISNAVETVSRKNGIEYLVYTNYAKTSDSLLLPSLIETKNGLSPKRSRLKYNKYDATGNVQEQQLSNNTKEVYLWGYHNQYPIVKIIGSSYDSVISKISQQQIDAVTAQSDNDVAIRTLLNTLRAAFSDNPLVEVWTYTYKPLVGMTSETDPRGNITYYEYDGLNRLKLAKDKDGKILKQYQYHYIVE